MTKWITLKQAAAKYDTDARNIKYWGQKGAITVARIGETWMVDDASITSYLENVKAVECLNKELISLKEGYESQIANCIETNSERLFLLKSLKEIMSLFRLLIYELASVIKVEEQRDIFISISNGEPVLSIAERMGTTCDKVTRMYERTIREVSRKYGGVRKWRNEKADMLKELNRTKTRLKELEDSFLQKMEKENASMENSSEGDRQIFGLLNVYGKDADVLSVSVANVRGFDTQIKNLFRSMDITSIGDLLLFIKKNGWDGLLRQKNFGLHKLRLTQDQLEKMGLLDKDGQIPYFLCGYKK